MGSRTWIKIYCDRWLEGTLRKESLELRGAWADILALAGKSNYGDAGEIKVTKNIGLSDEIIASIMKISKEKWREIKAKLIKTGRIRVLKGNIIKIVKWHKYQSEYGRTKDMPSRISTNSTTKSTNKSTSQSTKEIEREKEIEKKNIKKGVILTQLQQKSFDLFWKAYPYKKSKGQAEKAWKKIDPDPELLTIMISKIEKAKESVKWVRDNGEYIPHPATWLNARGWEDEDIEIRPGEIQYGARMKCKQCGDSGQYINIDEDGLCAMCLTKLFKGMK